MLELDADRVAPKLWVGAAPTGRIHGVDAVILMAREHVPNPNWAPLVEYAPIDDAVPDEREVRTIIRAARRINELRRSGRRVLVLCHAGANRSAVAAATALIDGGYSARDAVQTLRRTRRPRSGHRVLGNAAFVQFLFGYAVTRGYDAAAVRIY